MLVRKDASLLECFEVCLWVESLCSQVLRVSLALSMTCARYLSGEDSLVVAVGASHPWNLRPADGSLYWFSWCWVGIVLPE